MKHQANIIDAANRVVGSGERPVGGAPYSYLGRIVRTFWGWVSSLALLFHFLFDDNLMKSELIILVISHYLSK